MLFSDIRGFTTITEELGAQGTVALLNEYFTIMVDCIHDEGGMLDKFIGDAIMAAFGAADLARRRRRPRACAPRSAMITRAAAGGTLSASREGQKPVEMGIGLNTDDVVSGNIGSPQAHGLHAHRRRREPRLAAGKRLQAAIGARILISESTYAKLRGTYRVREADRVVVKGKTEPVGVYEVLDYHDDETFPNAMEVIGYTNEGQKHFRAGKFERAASYFRKAAALNPSDGITNLYLSRCDILAKDPPPKDWDGVWVMKEK